MMVHDQPTDTRHIVVVRYIDKARANCEVEFAAWTPADAVYLAWRFVRTRRLSGDILTFRCLDKRASLI